MKNVIRKNSIETIVLAGIILIYIASICLINFSVVPSFYDADMYCDYQYAVMAWEQKSLFPDGWVFGNQLNAVSTPVLAAVIYGLTGSPNLSMAVACTVMAVLVLICFEWMMSPVLKHLESRLFSLVVFMTVVLYYGNAVSGNMGWSLFFTMCSYYAGYCITVFLAFGCYVRSVKGLRKKDWPIVILTCILAFGTGIQSIRLTVVMVLPMVASEVLRLLVSMRRQKGHCHPLWVTAAIGASNLLGLMFVRMVKINQVEIFGEISLTPLAELTEAIRKCILMILSLLSNGNPECYLILGMLFLLCIAGLVGCMVGARNQDAGGCVLLILIGMSVLAIVGIDILTTMYVRSRYYFMLYPLIAYLIAWVYDRYRNALKWGLLLFSVAFFGFSCVRELTDVCIQIKERKYEESFEIGEYLLDRGYSVIYSVWGHAEDCAIATDGALTVGYWNDPEEPFVPMEYLYNMAIYQTEPKHCVYMFDGADAVEKGRRKAESVHIAMELLCHFPDSDTYLLTAPVNLMTVFE